MKKKIRIMLLLILVCFSYIFPINSFAYGTERYIADKDRVIKVCLPLQDGFAEINENGEYSGYTYEYLMKIAQRTGWKYEFIPLKVTNENLLSAFEKVESGEIDLIGAMNYNQALAETYAYASMPYGESSYILVANDTDNEINSRTIYDMPVVRVVLIEQAQVENKYFYDFLENTDINFEIVNCNNKEERKELLDKGQADVMITKDIVDLSGLRPVLTIGSQPFYFATAKNNQFLAKEISKSINEINQTDRYFGLDLYYRYFYNKYDIDLTLTADEVEFINNSEPIKTLVVSNIAPIQNYDKNSRIFSGISIDILKEISKVSGLEFEFISIDSYDSVMHYLDEYDADLVLGIPYYYYNNSQGYDMLLTSPIFSSPIVRIFNKDSKGIDDEVLIASSMKYIDIIEKPKYIGDLKEIFNSVNKGVYKQAYINGYMAQYFVDRNYVPNVTLTQTPFANYDLSIGVSRNADLRLMSILEQSIANLEREKIEDIVYTNTTYIRENNFINSIKQNPIEFMMIIISSSIVACILMIALFLKTSRLNKNITAEKTLYEKRSQLDQLTETFNNIAFKKHCQEYLNFANQETKGALLICDIDNFKHINDTYGHLTGDKVIHNMGTMLKEIFRSADIVGRLGGDEFVVLIKGTNEKDILSMRCKKILEYSKDIIEEENIYVSIGVACFDGETTFDQLFKRADEALYDVKNSGKKGFKIV